MKNLFLILFLFFAKILIAQSVIFRTTVDKLRLRESPNLESKVIKTVEKGTNLFWLDVRSEQKITADWKGGKATDYWYKVNYDFGRKDSVAWVFGKGIELARLEFKDFNRKDSIVYTVDNQWVRIEKSNNKAFNSLIITPVKWIGNPRLSEGWSLKGKPFTLKFYNGKSEIYNEFENQEQQLIGELPENGFYIIEGGICCEVYSAVRKSDGKRIGYIHMPMLYQNKIPIFTSDKKTFVSQLGCEPGGIDGLAFFEIDNNEIKEIFSMPLFPIKDFRFITNRSGIAKMQDNSYLKITIKPY